MERRTAYDPGLSRLELNSSKSRIENEGIGVFAHAFPFVIRVSTIWFRAG
jgi:hypothetical protein